MKVNDPNLSSTGSAGASRTQETTRTGTAGRSGNTSTNGASIGDDVHLSELVRSLRSLASDSPERQAKLEELARTYATGNYKTDPAATASKIIDDAIEK
jgi:anti-sigma28 factor (negative regulator of flagellin synthesis)